METNRTKNILFVGFYIPLIIILQSKVWPTPHELCHLIGCIITNNEVVSISLLNQPHVECMPLADNFSKLAFYSLPYVLNLLVIAFYAFKDVKYRVFQIPPQILIELPLDLAYLNTIVNLVVGLLYPEADINAFLKIERLSFIPWPGVILIISTILLSTYLYYRAFIKTGRINYVRELVK